jgi:hypothetical protein
VCIVAVILLTAIGVNVTVNVLYPQYADRFPVHRRGPCGSRCSRCAPLRAPAWEVMPAAIKGSVFLLALVLCASMMPVSSCRAVLAYRPRPRIRVGRVRQHSLTKLALDQNGYDWGMLAYTVGFGGSMIWFGSSAGVALVSDFPDARSASRGCATAGTSRSGYVVGFALLLILNGWNPEPIAR